MGNHLLGRHRSQRPLAVPAMPKNLFMKNDS